MRIVSGVLAFLLCAAGVACGTSATDAHPIPVSGDWLGTAAPSVTNAGMEMSIKLAESAGGELTGEGDVRLFGGGSARAEVIKIASGLHRSSNVSFTLTNGVVFKGSIDPTGAAIHFQVVPRPDRPYSPEITLHRAVP